jgi:hypothetical protein
MKKQIFTVALSALFVSSAFATTLPANRVITPIACPTISTPITINTSSGVNGAYSCNVVGNAAAVALCHSAGSRQARVVGCVLLDDPDGEADSGDEVYNNAGACPAGDGTAQDGEFTIVDFRGFVASTTGGGVGASQLDGACTDTSADALLPF